MRCVRCDIESLEDARFCDGCGGPLSRACPACQTVARANARFCSQCGTALESSPKPAPVAPPPPVGQRKHVTILFADVRGSTELIRSLDPEEALARIDPVVQGAAAAVARFGGIVNEVLGDGLMALFGAPLAAEDHPVCACLAARAILQGLPPGIEMRVGVHSGEVVIRPSGRDASDYTAIGPAVYLTKRLEQAADPGTARISADTARLTRGYTDLRPLGPIQAKGWDEPVEMFEMLRATDRPSWEVRSAGSLSPFVGRTTELAVLSSALMRATLGTMQAVVLVADAGVGKSRLAHEFLHGAAARGIRVVRAAAAAHAGTAPFHVAAELLRSWIGAVAGDDRAALARRLDQAIAVNLMQGATPDAAALQSLLDLPLLDLPAPEQAAWTVLDPARRRQRLIDVTRGVLLREAAQNPLIVLVEDLHWVDEASLDLLSALVTGAGVTRLLLFATTRPDQLPGRFPDWAARSNSTVLRLEPLERAESEALLQQLVGDAPELALLRARIIAQAEGTPLFLEEMARSLTESGALVHVPAQVHLNGRADDISIPASVQGIVASRMDRLPATQRRPLQTASVLGKDVRTEVLRVICHVPSGQMDADLTALQAAEFLYETSLGTREVYTFKHAVTQSVAYDTLLRAERRTLHAEAFSALERMSGDRLGEMLERLSDHAMAGEVWPAAQRYSLGAGRRANERYSWPEAIGYFDRALEATGHFENAHEAALAGIEIRLGLRVAMAATGNLDRCLAILEEARRLAAWVGDTIQVAQIDGYSCMMLTSLGALDQAVAAGERGTVSAAGHAPSMLNLAFGLGQAYWFQGRFAAAQATLSSSLPSIHGPMRLSSTGTNGTVSVLTLVALSKTHAMMGEFGPALALAAEAHAIATHTQRPYDLAYATVASGFAHVMLDAHEDAVAVLEQGLQIARRAGILLLLPSIARYLGRAYAGAGAAEKAHALLHEALTLTKSQRLIGLTVWCNAALGHAHMDGDAALAEAALREALAVATDHGYAPVQAQTLRALGQLHLRAGDGSAAEAALRHAVTLAEGMSMRPDLAAARRLLADALRALGRPGEAAAEDTAAAAISLALCPPADDSRASSDPTSLLA